MGNKQHKDDERQERQRHEGMGGKEKTGGTTAGRSTTGGRGEERGARGSSEERGGRSSEERGGRSSEERGGRSSEERGGRSSEERGGESRTARGGGRGQEDYEEWTKEELMERAKELDIPGRSNMSKNELISALRNQ